MLRSSQHAPLGSRSRRAVVLAAAFLALTVFFLASSRTGAQTPPPLAADSSVASQLAEINESLVRIALALETQREEQGLEVMMKRIELSERRLQPLEARLREARSDRESLLSQLAYSESALRETALRLESGESGMSVETLDHMTTQFELQSESVNAKVRVLEDEIALLENETTRQRREVEDWQSYVDRRLSGF